MTISLGSTVALWVDGTPNGRGAASANGHARLWSVLLCGLTYTEANAAGLVGKDGAGLFLRDRACVSRSV